MSGKKTNKSVHIFISPSFYKCLDYERVRTQKRLRLSRELTFPEFSDMYIKSWKRLPPFKLNSRRGYAKAKKR